MATTKYLQVPELRLSGSGVTATATTITVDKFEFAQGAEVQTTDIGDKMYASLEPKTARSEIISFTGFTRAADGKVTFTGVTRGLKPYDPYDADTGLREQHAGGTKMVISNNPQMYDEIITFDNDETVTGEFTFPAGGDADAPKSGTVYSAPTDDLEYAAKKYVDEVAVAGAPDANETTKGIVELATEAETLAGTDTGSTSAYLFAKPSQIAKNIQNSVHTYGAHVGAVDNYAINPSPAISAYAEGQVFYFKAGVANTGACSLNVNSLGYKGIKKTSGDFTSDGDIALGSIVEVIYDGTEFIMLSQQSSMPTTALLEESATFFNATDISGAEAETLTDGSDADRLHTHPAITNLGTSPDGTLYTYQMSLAEANWTLAVGTAFVENASYSLIESAGDNWSIYSNIIGVGSDDAFQYDSGKNLTIEWRAKRSGLTAGRLSLGFGYGVVGDTGGSITFSIDASENIYAHTADGVGFTDTDITAGITVGDWNTYKMVYDYDTSVKFYINNVLKATHTTNIYTPASTMALLFRGSLNGDDLIITAPIVTIEL